MYEAHHISVHLAGRLIVADADLEIPPGRVVVMIGPNGAGKSTLLRAIAGERRPASGTVTIHGKDVTAMSSATLAGWRAVLGQSVMLAAPFTVAEVVRLGVPRLMRNADADGLVARALAAVGLSDEAARPITRLSGGEQQRAHAARALVQIWSQPDDGHARYLLLDEPTAHLDPAHQHLVARLARAEAQRGSGVLAVLHDLDLAAAVADIVIVLHRGRIIASGAPTTVMTGALLREVYGIDFSIVHAGGRMRVTPEYDLSHSMHVDDDDQKAEPADATAP
jgi:iron complex transport system ATP-binding protein